MEEVCRKLEDLMSEMETLREEYRAKSELSENLRRTHEAQLARLQEAKAQIEKQSAEIDGKVEEISLSKKMYEDLESRLMEKESALNQLALLNENLRASTREKLMDLEGRNRELASALDEANTKLEEQEREICSYKEEIKGLNGLLIKSQKQCSDAELRAQASKEVRRRGEMLQKLEEEKMDVENQLKWKMEQFMHLEEAHGKLQDEFRVAKKLWGLERSTLVDKIQTLQLNFDSQAVSAHLKQENQELQTSLREYQDAQAIEADTASSLKTLRNKFRALEHAHRRCAEKLKAKEIEWRTHVVKLEKDLDDCRCQLNSKDKRLLDLQLELEDCQSLLMQQKLDIEEIATVLLLVESKFSKSCSVIENLKLEMSQYNAIYAGKFDVLMGQSEKNTALIQAQAETQKEHDAFESLQRRANYLETVAQKNGVLEKELEECRGMLEESYRNLGYIKEQASRKEIHILDDLRSASDELDRANYALSEKTTELSKMQCELQQQTSIMEKIKLDLETELNNYRDENKATRKNLDFAIVAKMEAENKLRQVKEDLLELTKEKDKIIEELKQHVVLLEEDNGRIESKFASLFKSEVKKFSETEKKFLEFAKYTHRRLKETQGLINKLEEKFISSETTILMTFEQEIFKYLRVMEDYDKSITGLLHDVLSLEEDVTCSVEAITDSQLKDKQLEIHSLRDDLEYMAATYVLMEQESKFQSIFAVELEKEINMLLLNLKSEEILSLNSKNCIEQLKVQLSMQSLENEKKHVEVLDELNFLQIEKRTLVDQLGKLKDNIEALHNINAKLLSEKEELIQEMMGFNNMIGMMYHADEELLRNWDEVLQKAEDENSVTKFDKKYPFNSDIIDDRKYISLKNSIQLVSGKRSPLNEHNWLFKLVRYCRPRSILLVNKCVVADESARLGPRVDVGSLLSIDLDAEVAMPSGRGADQRLWVFGPVGSSPSCTRWQLLG
ncbi:hypothetical protein C4D60_Mb04t18730 [Musa balbisiana]|uniref:Uncharacterized protein n=1 Tax=Musa balbisiana TaxID=52838 RepID=A0A4S8KCZ0_MUSBA|nr:hypothetical protein C4D60_Mb04t18730 [Musa balbisiana]